MAEAAQSLPHQVMKSRDGGEPGTPGFSQQDHLPFSSWRSVITYFGSLLFGLFQFVHFNLLGLG
jgi:hypothetical protein